MPTPTKFIPEIRASILEAVASGMGIVTAAGYAGVTDRVVKQWIARGRLAMEVAETTDTPIPAEDQPFVQFALDVEQSRAKAIARNILQVQRHAATDWRAAAWWLERMHPDEFGRSDKLAVTGAGGGPLQAELTIGQTDRQVAIDVAAHPARLDAMARALADAGVLGAIETTATEVTDESHDG